MLFHQINSDDQLYNLIEELRNKKNWLANTEKELCEESIASEDIHRLNEQLENAKVISVNVISKSDRIELIIYLTFLHVT